MTKDVAVLMDSYSKVVWILYYASPQLWKHTVASPFGGGGEGGGRDNQETMVYYIQHGSHMPLNWDWNTMTTYTTENPVAKPCAGSLYKYNVIFTNPLSTCSILSSLCLVLYVFFFPFLTLHPTSPDILVTAFDSS